MLARADDPIGSYHAAARVDTLTGEQQALEAIRSAGARGMSARAAKDAFVAHKDFSSVSGRFTALKRKRLVFPTGALDERGSEILVAAEFATQWWFTPEEVEQMRSAP
jgi:hypothetical protein